jgi:ABC-type Fe3+/spermidine/putrescine transport system ATPase subunit
MPKVTLKGISNYILKDLSLTINSGEFLVLVGPNGAGKSTLLNIVAGLADYSGSVLFDDRPIDRLPPPGRNIGYLFQNLALFPHMDVRRNIGYGLRARGRKDSQYINGRVEELLRMMQIEHLAARYPKNLSGGERQRVALARVLAVSPDVLLMDEPLNSLDLRSAKYLRMEIRHIQRNLGITTIFVTHNFAEALEMADRIAMIDHGRLLAISAPADIMANRFDDRVHRLIGKTNIFDCQAYNIIDNGLAAVECGQMKIIVPHEGNPVHRIAIAPEHVYVSTEAPLGPQVNRFEGVVRGMEEKTSFVKLSIQVCDQLIDAELSGEIANMMNLSVGSRVHIILKLRWLHPFNRKGSENGNL